ncbi:MAG: hypothetical protein E4G95_03030 [Bacteroidia bacterium]|nr:MAG: hypothetical protein E4G95_03030 [Bacteroidia bacterium]
MNTIWIYLAKASLSLVLFYLVFWIFLRKETLFITNRYYLLISMVISLILPMVTISYTVELSGDEIIKDTGSFLHIPGLSQESRVGLPTGLLVPGIIYFTGVIIFLLRIAIQFIVLYSIIVRNGIKEVDGTRIVYNSRFIMPFSFMNLVFINPVTVRDSEISDIIAHEKVHIHENHWFDLMIVELMSIILWFNPFIWFFERSIKQNHEYLADEGVIAQGYNVGRYHSVLINQLMGMEVIGITNNLNYSLNAKRLKMMKRTKTPKARALHIIWALPVTFLLLAAFASPKYVNNEDASQVASLSSATTVNLTVAVLDKNGDPVTGANVKVKGTSTGTITDENGIFSLEVSETDVVIVSMKGFEDVVIDMKTVAAKQANTGKYSLKVKMKALGETVSAYTVVKSKDDMIKELEITLKNLEVKKAELNKVKEKIMQAEKEGTVEQAELDKKKAALKADMTAVSSKIDAVTKKLQSLKN